MTAVSTALNTYDIVVLILPYLCHDGFPKDLLFLQRVNTTWRAVIQNSPKLQRSLWPTRGPAEPYTRRSFKNTAKLSIHLKSLIWVYSTKLQKIVGLYRSPSSVRNLYCEGRASCLDMRLTEANKGVLLTHQLRQLEARQRWCRGPCNTVGEAVQIVARSYGEWYYLAKGDQKLVAFGFEWDYPGLLVKVREVQLGGEWTEALKVG